jgi:hypothetical protein
MEAKSKLSVHKLFSSLQQNVVDPTDKHIEQLGEKMTKLSGKKVEEAK